MNRATQNSNNQTVIPPQPPPASAQVDPELTKQYEPNKAVVVPGIHPIIEPQR